MIEVGDIMLLFVERFIQIANIALLREPVAPYRATSSGWSWLGLACVHHDD